MDRAEPSYQSSSSKSIAQLWRENGLSISMFALFALTLVGMTIAGYLDYNQEQEAHKQATASFLEYLGSGSYLEAVAENWESEFLQMGVYVVVTIFLFQKGSPESKKLDEKEPEDEDPRNAKLTATTPWPVRQGGLILKLYENSLSIALFALFLISFVLHVIGGAHAYCDEQLQHGEQCVSTLAFLAHPRLWFQSFQNWQSEFLSIGMLVALSVFLRQKGSPESKAVAAPHDQTGQD